MTPEMKKRIQRAIESTWNAIAFDVLSDDGETISRDVAIEVTLDADRVRTFGFDPEAAESLYSMPYKQMVKVAKGAFPYEEYGY